MSEQTDRYAYLWQGYKGGTLNNDELNEFMRRLVEQADRREAGHEEVLSSSVLPVTGSASPSALTPEQAASGITALVYHRKLAEAIAGALGEQVGFSIRAVMTKEPIWPIIAAVLASEGVVDPEVLSLQFERANKAWSKVERLSKDLKSVAEESADRMMIAHERFKQLAALRSKVAEAEKILAEDVKWYDIARHDDLRANALAALRSTGDSDAAAMGADIKQKESA